MTILTYNPTPSLSHWSFSSFRPNRRLVVSATVTARVMQCTVRPATLYELLSVSETAAPEEIKAAYKKQARLWHPDVCLSSDDKGLFSEKFKRAREAYEVLCDPVLREDYDLALRAGIPSSSWGTTLGGGDGRLRATARDWESQLDGLQRRKASRAAANTDTWGRRMRSTTQSGLSE